MWWLIVGGTLFVVGLAVAVRVAVNAVGERSGAAGGLALAIGASLAFWGLAAVVVGLVVTHR
ncbi:hypothetical protein GCM10007967_33720 [Xylanimonas ulmi]|uniref:Uncharacterized protein n=1 Tax=Xylanimonas ulmi TaxID=228973 RepID=A0A4Q7LYJ4_9MICO|nr:hypothetical protein EV386_0569 [Xylanibacterium ulmi]